MRRFASVIALIFAVVAGPILAQTFYSPEPTDSPQFTALVLGKPVRVPDGAGGGLIGIGKMAPPSFHFEKIKGTPYLLGSFTVPSGVEGRSAGDYYVVAEDKSLRVLAIFAYGGESLEIIDQGRLGIAGSAGEVRWEEVGREPLKYALSATPCDRLFTINRYTETLLMRLAPGFDRLEKFPLLTGVSLSFAVDARAYTDLHTAPATVLPPFQVESNDSPQMLAFVQGKSFPIPADLGGGFVEIGKPAPSTLILTRVEGSPWCRGRITMPPLDETPGGIFDFFAKEPDGPIEIISGGGFPAILLYQSNRTAPPNVEAVGLSTESSPSQPDQRRTLLATRFPNLVIAKGEDFEGFYRLRPGMKLVEALPIGGEVKLTLDLNRAAPKWIAEQEPLLAQAWSAPLGPDWATIERIGQEALAIVGDKDKATKIITTPGAKLWAAFTGANSESKGPGRALLKRFGEAALKEPYELGAFREIHEFSLLYPDTRPAGPLTEKLLEKYDAMTVGQLLNRDYLGATEAPALTALRHAGRIDSPEATQEDLSSFRFHIVHVVTEAEAEALLPKNTQLALRILTPEQEKTLLARVAALTLKELPAKESSLRSHLAALVNAKPSPLRTAAFSLLATLPDGELVPRGETELSYTPACAFAGFLLDYDQKEKFSPNEQADHLSSLLYRVRHRPLYDRLQDVLLAEQPTDILGALVNKSAEHKENSRLCAAFAGRRRDLELSHAQRGNYALAAILAVNQAESRGIPAPADRVSLIQLPTDASSENPWDRARFYVGKFIASAYPLLETNLDESVMLHRALNGSAELAFAPAFRDLGITVGSLADYALAIRSAQGEKTIPLRLAVSPARLVPADKAAKSPWNGHEHPLLATRWSDLKRAKQAVDNIGKTNEWAAHFYGTDSSEQELKEVRTRLAAARGNAQGYQGNVTAAATGLSNYEREKAALERDGIAVGRDPNRPDRVLTRELNSFENRSFANTIDNQKETLRRESAHQNYLNSEVASLEARERELVSQISEYRGKATNSSPDYINSSRNQLRDLQAYYDEAWAKIGTLPDNGASAQRNPLRVAALTDYRDQLWSELRYARGEKETELFWRRWWLSRTVDPRAEMKAPDLGGASFPKPVARPDAVDSIWRFEFEQALGVEERDDAVRHFLRGTAALASALPAKPELLDELKAACQRVIEHDKYLPERITYEASLYDDRTCYRLLKPLLSDRIGD